MEKFCEKIIFCDKGNYSFLEFQKIKSLIPKAEFIQGDAIETLLTISNLDVFFYRLDSNGEGGSGIYFFSNQHFEKIVSRLSPNGGFIISDGSNRRGPYWKKLNRTNGGELLGRHFKKRHDISYPHLRGNGKIVCIEVLPKLG